MKHLLGSATLLVCLVLTSGCGSRKIQTVSPTLPNFSSPAQAPLDPCLNGECEETETDSIIQPLNTTELHPGSDYIAELFQALIGQENSDALKNAVVGLTNLIARNIEAITALGQRVNSIPPNIIAHGKISGRSNAATRISLSHPAMVTISASGDFDTTKPNHPASLTIEVNGARIAADSVPAGSHGVHANAVVVVRLEAGDHRITVTGHSLNPLYRIYGAFYAIPTH